ncbi:MAG: hypothetical protein H7320_09515 [Ferruginibacter sp.]|nr:hypothetical protein [Ferruginibacter sp.]
MPVQINEIIIRDIITNDDEKSKAAPQPAAKRNSVGRTIDKMEVLELINEALKNKNER